MRGRNVTPDNNKFHDKYGEGLVCVNVTEKLWTTLKLCCSKKSRIKANVKISCAFTRI
jgi:3,4-dihydroxy-2-butanone 4-phosphate synthase